MIQYFNLIVAVSFIMATCIHRQNPGITRIYQNLLCIAFANINRVSSLIYLLLLIL